jgi:hypothetical protein
MAKKHPKDMTSDELIKHVFHPKIVTHLKKLVRELDEKPVKSRKLRKKASIREV